MRLSRLFSLSVLSLILLSGCDNKKEEPGSKPGASSGQPASKKTGTPVVTWEGGSITLEELQGYVGQMAPAARGRLEAPEQRRDYAEGLARFELFVAEARRRGYENDPEVQEALRRALVQRMIFKEFDEKPPEVTKEDVAAYYEVHKNEFVQPARFRYSHVLVPAPKGSADRAAKKKLAQGLHEKARKLQPLDFDSFDKLVTEASGNPAANPSEADTQLVTAEELKTRLGAEVATAASALKKVGDLAPLVESDQGFHLLKLTDSQPEKNQSVEAVTSMIRVRITRERREARLSKFVEELQSRSGFRTDEAALQKLKLDVNAPQVPASGPAPGFVPAPPPTR
ncbi:MAG TPA: peptidylprolyl isomerase [Myxococcaceae bacterium]|jgi:peptidyl-prolyl cis-trans isomerase C